MRLDFSTYDFGFRPDSRFDTTDTATTSPTATSSTFDFRLGRDGMDTDTIRLIDLLFFALGFAICDLRCYWRMEWKEIHWWRLGWRCLIVLAGMVLCAEEWRLIIKVETRLYT